MKLDVIDCAVRVTLPATFVEAILKLHRALDKDIAFALETGLVGRSGPLTGSNHEEVMMVVRPPSGRYAAEFLGTPVIARTLPEVFAVIVDMTAEVAPEALNKLSGMSARTRRFVARRPEAIHPSNNRLPVMQTASGWWISKNIGQEDLKRALRALCAAAGIVFGRDLKFPLHGLVSR